MDETRNEITFKVTKPQLEVINYSDIYCDNHNDSVGKEIRSVINYCKNGFKLI